ncbi:hypothetical protein PYH37_000991 [Sinorhizobium numidicum]|uniref:Uncharacterized protein n=1 Tax=Sinorhizobium numidicum TaxID=680248 RepID=A0ABY8CSD4_9HYPH|nr:hypothetical protein [Sinorhizobium numidicum]WEX75564.1 hypothetical protein PYH37_000991 [Sinorhizobium numidicum]WEX81561.1 hypothetical protein PYH38_000992 [Sinorhizobium numidicum]
MAILPNFGAATFIPRAPIDNPYLPLIPGHVLSYMGDEIDPDTGEVTTERNDLFTTSATFEVRGVATTVIRDTVYEDDVILEDTFDWYAQDTAGNVWYFGEIVINYEYDDDGNFTGVNHDGEWSADDPGNQPGWAMKASPEFGPAYYLEFAPGIAEDESIIAETGLSVKTAFGQFDDVIKIIDSSALSTGVEFKYYAPGVGEITELAVAPDGSTTSKVDLYRKGQVGVADPDDTDDVTPALAKLHEGKAVKDLADVRDLDVADFTGTTKEVTVIGGSTDSVDALGAYYFDAATGGISEARILLPDLSEVVRGSSVVVDVPEGQTLGLFLVRGVDEIGVDLEQFTDGGLHLTNLLTGLPASMTDLYAPTIMDDAGNILPIQPLSALGAADGSNLLNPAGSLQAIGLSSTVEGAEGIEIVGFEDRLNTSPEYDGDFNDAIVAVSDTPIAATTLQQLLIEAGGSKPSSPVGDLLAANPSNDALEGWMASDSFQFSEGALSAERIADAGKGIMAADFAAAFGDEAFAYDDGLGGTDVIGDRGTGIDVAGVTSLGADGFFFT